MLVEAPFVWWNAPFACQQVRLTITFATFVSIEAPFVYWNAPFACQLMNVHDAFATFVSPIVPMHSA